MLSVYHMTAFTIGFVMDLLFGDPYWLPHPIRWIGRLIGWLDRKRSDVDPTRLSFGFRTD